MAGTVLEPTCGEGAFLRAAREVFPTAELLGFDISPEYVARASEGLGDPPARLEVGDFFTLDWPAVVGELRTPLLVVGNPPWVTSSTLGAIFGTNHPEKRNARKDRGIDARTGASNFDISEWMIARLIAALVGREFFLAMLCKATVARRLMVEAARSRWPIDGAAYRIDARVHFAAAVDAVLLTIAPRSMLEADAGEQRWALYSSLHATTPSRFMGVCDGKLSSDVDAFDATRGLEGVSAVEWRSGIKHDCAKVMELVLDDAGSLVNGRGERVDIEPEYVFPLLKGSDVAHGRTQTNRRVIVPQSKLGADTAVLRERAPKTWRYLQQNRELFEGRKSRIYRGQPPFALFGVGDYSFHRHKVAVSGLHKQLEFRVVGPIDDRPTMLDDTCYFLPCQSAREADELARALNGPRARRFFEARVFWDAKRPIKKSLLGSLRLDALLGVES